MSPDCDLELDGGALARHCERCPRVFGAVHDLPPLILIPKKMLEPSLIESFENNSYFFLSALSFMLVLLFGMLLVAGYSMKFSLAILGVGRFGFWKSLGMVLAASFTSWIVSTMLMMAVPGEPVMALFAMVASVGTYCVVVSVMGGCSVGKGFAIYFLHCFLNLVGAVPLFMLIGIVFFTMSKTMDPNGTLMKQWSQQITKTSATGSGTAIGQGAGGLDLKQVMYQASGEDETESEDALEMPKRLPPVLTGDENSGGFFGLGKEERASPYPKPASGCRSSCSAPKPKPAPAPAVSHGPQSNPFVN
ncbi:hypothetical protein SAMN06265222_107187 [Neorhodopirellula lusitana]|uniref:Uncharacterized protein n=2 Tax=Neorhodopirellula lusitana TaxID=445327 RepID=A0ABY1Q892_9BACT|nr:hypothetical protein SAMN06265222_107187 [Neorhodopirellula lusitana]